MISSRNAAGYQGFYEGDFILSLRIRNYVVRRFHAGAEAEESIVRALGEAADRADGFDALVLIRGERFAERSGVLQQLSAVLLPGAVPVAGDRRDRT